MSFNQSVSDDDVAIDDRISEALSKVLQRVSREGKTDAELEADCGVKANTIKSYRLRTRKPSLGAGLVIAGSIGEWALNRILNIVQFGGAHPLGESDSLQPMQMVANAIGHLGVIGQAAADNRIDHIEKPATTEAADKLIATILPFSSAAKGKAA